MDSLFQNEQHPAITIERVFAASEDAIGELEKHLNAARASAQLAKTAAELGDVKALSRSLGELSAGLRAVGTLLETASSAIRFDFAAAIQNGTLLSEIEVSARTAGLPGVRLVQGVLMSFPAAVRASSDDLAIRIGSKRVATLRPSVIVSLMSKARKLRKPPGGAKFLDSIERAYNRVTNGRYQISAPLAEIHKELTPLPGQSLDFSLMDLVAALYSLERASTLESGSGRRLTFVASTSTRGGGGIRIATDTGEERVFSSIRFD